MTSTLIPLAKPTIGDDEVRAQERALRSGRLVLGLENVAFEEDLARAADVPHAVTVSSGTAALHAAYWALGLHTGGEIIVPAFTFPAPANVALALGLTVVAADVDGATWNIDPDAVARAITPRTRAIVAVDQFGMVAEHGRLAKLAADARVPLVEDAACAIGALDAAGRRAGSFGRLACFSFHPRKIVTTGEGGAVVTNDGELAARLRLLRHHGISAPGEFATVGLNFRMPETCAAVGAVQLGRLPAFLARRKQQIALYRAALVDRKLDQHLGFQTPPPGAVPTWQTFAVLLPPLADRARVIAHLRERQIESGPATFALHRIGSMAALPGMTKLRLPVADALHDRALALPLYHELGEPEIARVVAALAGALA